ncbi:subtilase family protein [Kribbella sp. VKM Ac-2571]|uniref:S8 family serine peptidase n=1 Tax=Kribbella sp. VKM Ac-2571 TaxID=2512222 RepID=UPI0010D32ECB|nr:S8 family serine peptidase [Kribbella sp. VKM Ac-2571]TDO58242.1 subtilase family protein [Kribbella sp. VKM Ac-2571]
MEPAAATGYADVVGVVATALTVGAVDKPDLLAEFASRGMRISGTLKPDISASGVAIVPGIFAE